MHYPASTLCRHDLIELEPLLRDALARVLSFTSHGLYFPREHTPEEAVWLPRERKLLVPLRHAGETLGMFMADGVRSKGLRALLPSLPGIVGICLENLELHKRIGLDELTGLSGSGLLPKCMVREMEQGRAEFVEMRPNALPRHGTMGLIVLRHGDAAQNAAQYGHGFVNELRKDAARMLSDNVPPNTSLFRCGEDEFALLLPEAAARSACARTCIALARTLNNFSGSAAGRKVFPRLSLGWAVYPRDLEGEHFSQPLEEQAALMIAKARLAARVAEEAGKGKLQNRIMEYARILHEGGRIRRILPLSHMIVGLGRETGARPGIRFFVLPPDADASGAARRKGEVELVEVDDTSSLARLVRPDDYEPETGDTLRLVPESAGVFREDEKPAKPADTEDAAGVLHARDFETRFNSPEHTTFRFALVGLTRDEGATAREDTRIARLAALCREHARPDFGTRYGNRGLLFFHSGVTANLEPLYGAALTAATEEDIRAAAGIATYPYLHFQRGEITECCVKALDLARLLPEPRVGLFGSLALNISADRQYSRGEIFRAVQEYEWALLADKNNANAWNSLGFCMASLSRHHEAHRYFSEALKRNSRDAAALYNLGVACLSLGQERAAARRFKRCLALRPDHAFALIRLGKLAAQAGRFKQAEQFLSQAATLREGAGIARRMLARLALSRNKPEQARSFLHEALRYNPGDFQAGSMLAKLYLDCGEDPSVAEMLARHSLSLAPDLEVAKQTLELALRLREKREEARIPATGGNPTP